MNWKNIRILGKLTIIASVTIFFTILIGIIAIVNIRTIAKNTETQTAYYIPIVNNTFRIEKNWNELLVFIHGFENEPSAFYKNKVNGRIDLVNKRLDEIIENAGKANLSNKTYEQIKDLKTKITEFKNVFNRFQEEALVAENYYYRIDSISEKLNQENKLNADLNRITSLINKSKLSKNIRVLANIDLMVSSLNASNLKMDLINFDAYVLNFKKSFLNACIIEVKIEENSLDIQNNIKSITNVIFDSFNENSENTNRIAERATILMIIAILIILTLSVFFTGATAQSIRIPILQSVKYAKEMASGNLNSVIKADRTDETGELIKALGYMAFKLKNMINNIKESAQQINNACTNLNSRSQQLANGASEQASATEEMASSIEQISATVHQNTENAKTTGMIAKFSSKQIIEGTSATSKAIISMNEIANKVHIINEIAFQTNLLALNAAVEAARAGAAGRGFAVVAAEVRKLAEKSKTAAVEIEQVSQETVNISALAGDQLEKVTPEILKTTELINDIVNSSLEQNNGINQIKNAVEQLNSVTQENVNSSELVSSSAVQLLSQAAQLLDTISFFKTIEEEKTLNQSGFVNRPEKEETKKYKAGEIFQKMPIKNQQDTINSKGYNLNLGLDNKDDEFEQF